MSLLAFFIHIFFIFWSQYISKCVSSFYFKGLNLYLFKMSFCKH